VIAFKPLETEDEHKWVKEIIRPVWCEDSVGLMAYDDTGIVGACVADSFTVTTCIVHIAVINPMILRHGFLEQIAEYLFIHRDRRKIIGIVPSDNVKALKLNKHIGFEKVAQLADFYDVGVDYVILELERDKCRWLQKERRAA
jgi:hypothetical protein